MAQIISSNLFLIFTVLYLIVVQCVSGSVNDDNYEAIAAGVPNYYQTLQKFANDLGLYLNDFKDNSNSTCSVESFYRDAQELQDRTLRFYDKILYCIKGWTSTLNSPIAKSLLNDVLIALRPFIPLQPLDDTSCTKASFMDELHGLHLVVLHLVKVAEYCLLCSLDGTIPFAARELLTNELKWF